MPNPSSPVVRKTPPTSNPNPSEVDRRKPWSTTDLAAVLDGSVDPGLAREADRKGLSMVSYGAMQAAVGTAALMPLLDLLEPPGEGESKIDQVISLLERMIESQGRIEAKLVALDSWSAALKPSSRA